MSLLSKYINRQLAAYQSELVQTHYQEVENMYRQIRGWRHDYRNHIQVLKSYAKDGDLAQISKYLDELDEDLSTVVIYSICRRFMYSLLFKANIWESYCSSRL